MDEKSASFAEAARRLLRTEGCVLEVPSDYASEASVLALLISDSLPSMIREPQVVSDAGWHYVCIKSGGELLARLAGPEPTADACWVPDTGEGENAIWLRWQHDLRDLLAAGYPGCVGCGGPGSEGEWDEIAARKHMLA
jgi:hypothetical protein